MPDHETYMETAICEALKAGEAGEIPVGAVIVRGNEIIARAHNENRSRSNPVKHAEIIAIEQAAGYLQNERLNGCTLYVTKEPCAMCAGAIIHARLDAVIIGTEDARFGACGTVLRVCGDPRLNHVPEIVFGIMRERCASLLTEFFRRLRDKNGSMD